LNANSVFVPAIGHRKEGCVLARFDERAAHSGLLERRPPV